MIPEPEILCDICHAPMKQVGVIGYQHGIIARLYRKRRFACTICDYTKMVFADGKTQEFIEQSNAERDSKNASNPIKRDNK